MHKSVDTTLIPEFNLADRSDRCSTVYTVRSREYRIIH